MLFCRVETSQINQLMESHELVVALIQDMGFSVEDKLSAQEILSII